MPLTRIDRLSLHSAGIRIAGGLRCAHRPIVADFFLAAMKVAKILIVTIQTCDTGMMGQHARTIQPKANEYRGGGRQVAVASLGTTS